MVWNTYASVWHCEHDFNVNKKVERHRECICLSIVCFSRRAKYGNMVSNKFIEIHFQTMENFSNVDLCSQLKLFAYLICYLHKRQRWCELLKMHVILRCKLQNSPYFIHASLSREHFPTARIRVCRFDIDECNLCVRIELYEFKHWPMPICPTLWCPVNGDSMRGKEDWLINVCLD